MPVVVHGLREMRQAFATADKELDRYVRTEFRRVAEPIRTEAESLAGSRISNIGVRWSRMRTGITRTAVYVAPRERSRQRGRRRPNLAGLLMNRAMQPALDHHETATVRAVDDTLDRICDQFNRGGPV